MKPPNATFRLQHRETGCWLIVDGYGPRQRDAWLGPKDGSHATQFSNAEDAKAAAKTFGLTPKHYKITQSHE
jgi:hypothetical protein